ncbi:MAG: thioredoxin family protein [Candidatus Brocadiaceae bacterium]|nr:thioredoxin family protein [Candidatus Brocadiaceae bacterium]
MMVRTAGLAVVLAVAVTFLSGVASAAETLKPGAEAPAFELFGVDYRYHSLEGAAEARARVLIFTCNHCPVAVSYEDTLVALGNEYQPKGIQFIAINTNPADMVAADGFPQMIERAKEKNLPYPYLYDETQKVSRAYGATVTPHIFVVGPEGTILYEGAADNRRREPNYLADALDAILAGRPVPDASTAEFGCTVKYRPEPREAQGE